MHVGEVDVAEGDGAAVGQVAGWPDPLGDRAGPILGCVYGRLIAAGATLFPYTTLFRSIAVVEGDGEALDLGLVLGQILDGGIRDRESTRLHSGHRCASDVVVR